MGIIAVSDVHLGYSSSNKEDFNLLLDSLLERNDIDKFVICGDLLDMWRRDIAGVAIENADTLYKLQRLKSVMNVYYVVGNHDYHVYRLRNFKYQFEFSKILALGESNRTYLFEHGYGFDPVMNEVYFNALCYSSDELGDIGSRAYAVWEKWAAWKDRLRAIFQAGRIKSDISTLLLPPEKRLAIAERNEINLNACKSVIGGEVLVFGHTHEPFINEKENVVNLGSWVKESPVHNTYLEVKNGSMALKIFPDGEITERRVC